MHEWLEAARERIAAESGVEPGRLALTDEEIDAVLELARVAAHGSGDRTNAPLVCFLAGVALGSAPATDLARLVRAAAGPGE